MTRLSPAYTRGCFSVMLPCPIFRQDAELLETMGLIELFRYSRPQNGPQNGHYTFWPGTNTVTGYLSINPDEELLEDSLAAQRLREMVL